jgi:hypothetical protein
MTFAGIRDVSLEKRSRPASKVVADAAGGRG